MLNIINQDGSRSADDRLSGFKKHNSGYSSQNIFLVQAGGSKHSFRFMASHFKNTASHFKTLFIRVVVSFFVQIFFFSDLFSLKNFFQAGAK